MTMRGHVSIVNERSNNNQMLRERSDNNLRDRNQKLIEALTEVKSQNKTLRVFVRK